MSTTPLAGLKVLELSHAIMGPTAGLILGDLGADVVKDARVVDSGQVISAGGVTAGIDLGLHLARRLVGDEAANAIAKRIEWRQETHDRA